MRFQLDGNQMSGVVVGFGVERLGDSEVRVAEGSVDRDTFQVHVEEEDVDGFVTTKRVPILGIIPVKNILPTTGVITNVQKIHGPFGTGAALIIDENIAEQVKQNSRVSIVLKGEFVLTIGPNTRAIDAEHVRAELPTGDRPAGVKVGIQGGTFESWVEFKRP